MTEFQPPLPALPVRVATAITTAAEAFFHLQTPDGSWQAAPEPAATPTAAAVIALHTADPGDSAEMVEAGIRWLLATQGVSGGWGDGPGAPPTPAATVLAAAALHLVAPVAAGADVERALGWIEGHGGAAAVLADRRRDPLPLVGLSLLAEAGLYDKDRVPPVSAALPLLPAGRGRRAAAGLVPVWRILERRTRRAPSRIRNLMTHRAESRILAAIEAVTPPRGPEGGAHGSPLLAAMHCFALARSGVRPDLVERMVGYLWLAMRRDGSWPVERDLEVSATIRIALGLHEAGYAGDRRLGRAVDWVSDTQWWARCTATGTPAGGWSRSVESGWPDAATTAAGVLALAAAGCDLSDSDFAAGVAWLTRTQNGDGSWGCCGYEDEQAGGTPCPVATSRAVAALCLARPDLPPDRSVVRATDWLGRAQRADGSFPCVGYRGATVGTSHVLEALGMLGLQESETARRARRWLLAHQHDDGGWGDGAGAPSSAEETAWALMSLAADSGPAAPRGPWLHRAAEYLVRTQSTSGLWPSALVSVRCFGLRYRDDLTAAGYAMQALGRYRAAVRG